MNENLEPKISNFFVALPVSKKVRNSRLLRAIRALTNPPGADWVREATPKG